MSARASALPAGYTALETVYEGRLSRVFRAVFDETGERVLLKTTRSAPPEVDEVEAIEREASLLSKLDGRGNCVPRGLEWSDRRPFLIFEDAGHRPLGRWRAESLLDFLRIATAAAEALAHVHRRGVIHRDIAPNNIVVRPDPFEVKLVDFGASLHRSDPEFHRPSTSLQGTLAYMSPEQTGRLECPVDGRSDLYSLGASLVELLSGAPPFRARDTLGYVHCHLSEDPPDVCARVPGTPPIVGAILSRLLQKDPGARYQSARGLAWDLRECLRRWESDEEIRAFDLASADSGQRLAEVQRLIERDDALAAFSDGITAPLVEISGPDGIGRSTLLRECCRQLDRAWPILIRCERVSRDVPFAGIEQLGRGVAEFLLSLPLLELTPVVDRLARDLGDNVGVLTETCGALSAVFRSCAPAPALSPREAAARQLSVLRTFVAGLTDSFPLVLAIDDAQWLDTTSARALSHLVRDGELDQLTIVVCSDGELPDALDAVGSVARIALQPLSLEGVVELLREMLGTDEGHRALAQGLHDLTGGLPGVTIDAIRHLHAEGGLHFDDASGRWTFDASALARVPVGADVAAHLLARLDPLADIRAGLEAASCFETGFETRQLAAVLGRPDDEVEELLYRAAVHGVVMLGERWEFVHPSLRSAVYAAMDPQRRARAHAAIGAALAETTPPEALDGRIWEIAGHLRAGVDATSSQDEIRRASEALERAGAIALEGSGHSEAARAYADALELAERLEHASEHRLFELARARADATLLAGDLEAADAACDRLDARAYDGRSRAAALALRASIVQMRGDLPGGLALLREGLTHLGVVLPVDPQQVGAAVQDGMGRMQARLERTPPSHIPNLPEMGDPLHQARMDLLVRAVPAAYQIEPQTFLLVELTMFEETLDHGVTPAACKMLADLGLVQLKMFGDRGRGMELVEAGMALARRRYEAATGSVLFIEAGFFAQWQCDGEGIAEVFRRTHEASERAGDTVTANFGSMLGALLEVLRGTSLAAATSALEHAERVARAQSNGATARWARELRQRIDLLREGSTSGSHDAPDDAAPTRAIDDTQGRPVVELLLGNLEQAWVTQAQREAAKHLTQGFFSRGPNLCMGVVLRAARLPSIPAPDADATVAQMQDAVSTLASWAEINPAWFRLFHDVAAAELARVSGAPLQDVVAAYERVEALGGTDGLHLRGWAAEQHGRLWLERGADGVAGGLLQRACEHYTRLGAMHRVDRLRAEFGGLLEPPSTPQRAGSTSSSRTGSRDLDIESITRATRALSTLVRPEALHEALMATVVENAGAQRGVLLLPEHDGFTAVVQATGRACTSVREPLDHCRASAPAVQLVARTHEVLVLDDAGVDHRFAQDPHVTGTGVRSLVCAPVLNRGELLAIVYLEHNAIPRAFTASRVQMLQILVSQAAASIQNARVFAELETRVEDRTHALAAQQRQTQALFDALPLGVLTIDDELRIEPHFSDRLPSIVGEASPGGKLLDEVVFRNADLTAEQRSAHRSALVMTFGAPSFLADMNWAHLISSFERSEADGSVRSFEIDWAPIIDEHGNVSRALAAVRDVTRIRALQRSVEESERQAQVLQQLVDTGAEAFERFERSSVAQLEECVALIESGAPLQVEALERIFRNLHTIKGNARSLGLTHLSVVAHVVEEPYAALRSANDASIDRAALRAGLASLREVLEEYACVMRERLVPLMGSGHARDRALLDQVRAVLDEGGSSPERALDALAALLRSSDADTLRDVVESVASSLPSLARELDKPAPRLAQTGIDAQLDRPFAQMLRSALTHALRNALDHGIEDVTTRRRLHKPEQGRITVEAQRLPGGLRIRITDDGAGLNMQHLRSMRPNAPDELALAEHVFDSGISTAERVTAVSGRGVGLNAVRAFLEDRGGRAGIEFCGPERHGRRPFALVLDLPEHALVRPDARPEAVA